PVASMSLADLRGRWVAFEVHATDADPAPGVEVTITATPIFDPDAAVVASGLTTNLDSAGGVDRITAISIAAREDETSSVGWLTVADEPLPAYIDAAVAWEDERAGERMLRIASGQGVTLAMEGDPAETEPLGPQPIAKLIDGLGDAATADWGLLDEGHE